MASEEPSVVPDTQLTEDNHDNQDDHDHHVNQSAIGTQDSSDRRKSGRTTRKPELFSSQQYEANRGGKRKRTGTGDEEAGSAGSADENDEEEDEESSEEDEDEDVADEEELKARKRAARGRGRTSSGGGGKKSRAPSKKKARVNGGTTQLAFRPAAAAAPAAKPKTTRRRRVRPSEFANEDGLYAEVFGRSNSPETVAADWLTRYERHNVNALSEFVNFILCCSGTSLSVTADDISDVDNAANRLNDLQEEYQSTGIVEYPLISRAKKYRGFEDSLSDFIEGLIRTLHAAGVLYNDEVLVENIMVWITSMSSAAIRPFRHTATLVSLSMVTALCLIASELQTTTANLRKRLGIEKKKKTLNAGRIEAMQAQITQFEGRLETVGRHISDSIDTVFVHRYRDVDPRIRCACIAHLGKWIALYRQEFFDSNYLRYMGWVLSDPSPATRGTVLAQLKRIFAVKENIPGLRVFTEKFRPRIVEVACQDAEQDVRAAAVELLDQIRECGFLEQEDVDAVGRLVFDAEPRVRAAAGRFFVANVGDVCESVTEGLEEGVAGLGDDEEDEEVDVDEFVTPRRSWVKFKCLVDVLGSYDDAQTQNTGSLANALRDGAGTLVSEKLKSRFVLATEAIYPHFPELHRWESLAGYLLYDHSSIPDSGDDSDANYALKKLYKLNEGQESLLLEVLGTAVKLYILQLRTSDTDKRGKKTKQLVQEKEEREQAVAHHLSQLIPQLLSKFGSVPAAASAILRLEHLLDLDAVNDLQKGVSAYEDILKGVNKQFSTHSDRAVLAEATAAFLHARSSEELRDAIEAQVGELWRGTLGELRTLTGDEEGGVEEQELPVEVLRPLCSTVARIQNLAGVADCTSMLEGEDGGRQREADADAKAPVDVISSLARRALRPEEISDEETDGLERELIAGAFRVLLVYFLWKIKRVKDALVASASSGNKLGKDLDATTLSALSHRRDAFSALLSDTISIKSGVDSLRLSATRHLLDLHIAFGTLRYASPEGTELGAGLEEDAADLLRGLITEVSPSTASTISRVHDALEKRFAKKAHKTLEAPAEEDTDPDAAPEDVESSSSESESSDEEDGGDDDDERRLRLAAKRERETLLAEQALCEVTGKIVLAIVGRVLDVSGQNAGRLREKVSRNKGRLGAGYKEVVAYLDPAKVAGQAVTRGRGGRGRGGANVRGRGGRAATAGRGGKQSAKSLEVVVEDDEDEEGDNQVRGDPIEEEAEHEERQQQRLLDIEDDGELLDVPGNIEDVEMEL